MDGEIQSFFKVFILAIISLCYCYYMSAKVSRSLLRFLSLLPIFYLFIILPFNLSSIHLRGLSSFLLVWLAIFKLLLFCVGQGPLSDPTPPTLFHFISIGCLPIKVKQVPASQSPQKFNPNTNKSSHIDPSTTIPKAILFPIKVVILAVVFHMYEYRQHFHKYMLLTLYCIHVYIQLEIILALVATPARAFLGFEIEPQFNEPYLATSLQDFWGRRWNLMVSRILHPTVYSPVRRISTYMVGSRWASLPAIVAAFVVSGLMHELIYYYLVRVSPTWEVTWFFVLHGICVAIEVAVKKVVVTDRWRLHPVVSGLLTVVFVAVTGFWLFFPQLLRNGVDDKVIEECSVFVDFVKGVLPFRLPFGHEK